MNPDRVGRWRKSGVQDKTIYVLTEEDLGRVGNCWMQDRLFVGDLVTPIQLSGDCFYYYQLIEGGDAGSRGTTKGHLRHTSVNNGKGLHCYNICKGAVFGAYAMGTPFEFQPTEREWHLLMAGEHVTFSEHIDVEESLRKHAKDANKELDDIIANAIESARKEINGE